MDRIPAGVPHAVFCVFLGFMAENFREYRSDNTKEKEYMSSMLSDLKLDTLILNQLITNDNLRSPDGTQLCIF